MRKNQKVFGKYFILVIAKMTLTNSQALGTPQFSKDLHPLFKKGVSNNLKQSVQCTFCTCLPFFLFIRCDNLAKINLALHRCFFFSSPCNILTTFFFLFRNSQNAARPSIASIPRQRNTAINTESATERYFCKKSHKKCQKMP